MHSGLFLCQFLVLYALFQCIPDTLMIICISISITLLFGTFFASLLYNPPASHVDLSKLPYNEATKLPSNFGPRSQIQRLRVLKYATCKPEIYRNAFGDIIRDFDFATFFRAPYTMVRFSTCSNKMRYRPIILPYQIYRTAST